jgi:hypothetical protein
MNSTEHDVKLESDNESIFKILSNSVALNGIGKRN